MREMIISELSQALHNIDPILRAHALEGIRQSNSTAHQPEILLALHDADARVRFAAALTAGELRLKEAHEALLAIADDPSENVRVAVRFASWSLIVRSNSWRAAVRLTSWRATGTSALWQAPARHPRLSSSP